VVELDRRKNIEEQGQTALKGDSLERRGPSKDYGTIEGPRRSLKVFGIDDGREGTQQTIFGIKERGRRT